MGENWYKSDCEKCEHLILSDFIESKGCSLSPLEKCPYEDESYCDDCNDEDDCSGKIKTEQKDE